MRALRLRRGWRQTDLGGRAGLSRDAVSRAELGRLDGLTVGSLNQLCEALGATLVVEVRWQGAALDRLVDRKHAQLQDEVARRLTAAGWIVRAEVTFNHYGDRGSCDLVAWHPVYRILLIVEVKTRLGNLQDTLHRLDTKVRLAGIISRDLGYGPPASAVRALVLAEDSTNRRIVARHRALLGTFAIQGRATRRWLRRPTAQAAGLLWFQTLSDSGNRRTTDAKRVRNHRPAGSQPQMTDRRTDDTDTAAAN